MNSSFDTDTAAPARALQLPSSLLFTLLAAVAAERDPMHAVDLLRQAGYDAGAGVYALLQQRAEEHGSDSLDSLPAAEFWSRFTELWESLGWGRIEHRQTHPGVAELTSSNWVEADAPSGGLGCQVTTGLFADVLRRVAGEDVAVLEVECRGRGDSRCRFLVGSAEALGALHESMRQGESAENWLTRSA